MPLDRMRPERSWRLGWIKRMTVPKNSVCGVTEFGSGRPGKAVTADRCLCSAACAVYHYQMKIHVFSYKNATEIEPTFYVTLYGINADSQMLLLET